MINHQGDIAYLQNSSGVSDIEKFSQILKETIFDKNAFQISEAWNDYRIIYKLGERA